MVVGRGQLEGVFAQLPGRYRRYLALADRRAESGIETRARLGLRAVLPLGYPQVMFEWPRVVAAVMP